MDIKVFFKLVGILLELIIYCFLFVWRLLINFFLLLYMFEVWLSDNIVLIFRGGVVFIIVKVYFVFIIKIVKK